ncbi:Cache 3/Cache 2 fusion domain-containing protein [Chitinilyticum piscinae]|uniref:histidine kinase n=1 Tax=Chitinilyticum piscinae TaxID=2866724 RepID=A0A8J7K118_9NEIS|nr:Cache 3/Cache 2 fusion domain-containing protein [Chitinilyticum piscinae]MBE9608561.1 Cache 3/Cache 2 fusion domain-containing protein [Chitinilyticum piscinae]
MKRFSLHSTATRLLLASCVVAVLVVTTIVLFVKLALIPQLTEQALKNQTYALAYSLKNAFSSPEQWTEANLSQQNGLLDGYSNEGKGTATLFLFKNGEYTRMSTTLLKEDGTRAVGTILKPESPAAQALKAGKTYVGPIELFGRPHMATYLPVQFANGVKGSVYIGVDYQSADPMVALSRQMDWMVLGVGGTCVLLLVLGFGFAMRVEQNSREIEDIMRTMQEGLFLLDGELRVGRQTTQALSEILGFAVQPGAYFLDLLKPFVSPKTFATAKDYIELLLRHDVKEKLVTSLNPLDCIEISTMRPNGEMEVRYLNVRFNRVVKGSEVTHLLVTAKDITRQVRLERALQDSERRVQGQMAMLIKILQADASLLQDFINRALQQLEGMNESMRTTQARVGLSNQQIVDMLKGLHRLKGDAASLQLDEVVKDIHEIESAFQCLQEQPERKGESLLPVTVRMKQLFVDLGSIREICAQLSQYGAAVAVEPSRHEGDPRSGLHPLVRQWRAFTQQLAQKQHKFADLSYRGMSPDALAAPLREAVNSMVNQFIRNALVHGVEMPAERRVRGKDETAHLSVYLSDLGDGTVELSFRDDGRGILLDELRQAAIRAGRLAAEEAAALDSRQLTMLIFESGFSTRKKADEDAGRGVGLDAVKDMIVRLGGRIRVGTTAGEYCHFRVRLPLQLVASPAEHTDLSRMEASK